MARDTWTDERLDDLNAKVDRGFEQVDRRFEQVDKRFEQVDRRFEQVDKRFEQVDRRFERLEDDVKEFRAEVNQRFDSMQWAMMAGLIAIVGCMFTGFAGLIAAQIWA